MSADQENPYPPELRWPAFSFTAKIPFVKKMIKTGYFVYESNHLFYKGKKHERNLAKTHLHSAIYYGFYWGLVKHFNIEMRALHDPVQCDKEGHVMDNNWYVARSGIYFKSNHCGVQGDLILISKERPDLKTWFDANKPEFVTEFTF